MEGFEVRRVLIDTDPGIDDTAALLFAFGSGRLRVEALTTVFGNTDVAACTRNALAVLEAAGHPDVPVYQGAAAPLLRTTELLGRAVHGDDGLGGVDVSPAGSARPGRAAVQIVERVMAAPGELDLLALGPLTNVALALALEPDVARSVRSLIVMGGAVHTWGNVTPRASANLHNDPEAAAIVYRSGAPIVQVGLDVCRKVHITPAQRERIGAAGTPGGDLLLAATPFIEDAYRRMGVPTVVEGRGVHYNDVPCIAYLLAPELFTTEHLHVAIETHGEHTLGETVADVMRTGSQPPNAQVCVDADAEGIAELFTRCVAGEEVAW